VERWGRIRKTTVKARCGEGLYEGEGDKETVEIDVLLYEVRYHGQIQGSMP
jgi:hypothetical protein